LPKEEGGEVLQGHLEGANVNPVVAMTQIINVQRTFEVLQRVVKTYREVDAQSMRRAR
jgi:flagellar basal body rod protein FlgG